jgi:hypothetical protein
MGTRCLSDLYPDSSCENHQFQASFNGIIDMNNIIAYSMRDVQLSES